MLMPPALILGSSGGVMILAAAWLLALRFSDRLNRTFALALLLRGAALTTRIVEPSGPALGALQRMSAYFGIAAPFAFLYFAACYWERFGGPSRRAAFWALLAAATAMETIYLTDPAGLAARSGWLAPTTEVLSMVSFGCVAGLFLRDALRPGHDRALSLLLGSVASSVLPLAYALHFLVPGLMPASTYMRWLMVVALAPTLYVVWLLARAARGGPLQGASRRALLVLAVPVASVGMLAVVDATAAPWVARITMVATMSSWALLWVVLSLYAVLRHQLFGIDMRLKWTLRRGTLAGVFVGTFFVVAQVAQAFFEHYFEGRDTIGAWAVAGVATGLLAFALSPLQRLADRVADAALPDVGSDGYLLFRKMQVYQSALEALLADGMIEERERRTLDRIRDRLAIPASAAAALERDVASALGMPRRA